MLIKEMLQRVDIDTHTTMAEGELLSVTTPTGSDTWTSVINSTAWIMAANLSGNNRSLLDDELTNGSSNGLFLDLDELEGYPYPSKYGWLHIILASIVVTFVIAAIVIGNTLVIVAIAVDHNLKALQNWFIASLAVSDLLLGVLIMPFSLANELMGYWFFGEVMCQLWLSIDVLLCTASILNLCLISLDRYWSITRAISYVKTRTKRRAIIMIAMVWVLSAIICFPPLAGWKRPQPERFGYPLCVLSEEIGYVVYSTMGSFYIPLLVMVVVYFKIYLAARARARKNLKKKKQTPEVGNANTSSSTSFGKQGEHKNGCGQAEIKAKEAQEGSSDIEDEPEPLSQIPEGAEMTDPGMESGAIPMSVTNHNAHLSGPDEKHKLLSEDTDTDTGPVWQLQANRLNRGLQISDMDTDSQSDCPPDRRNGYQPADKDTGNAENMKPLLQDSHPESESDKNSNRISPSEPMNGASSEDHTHITKRLPKVVVTKNPKKFIKPRFRKEKTVVNSKLLAPAGSSLRRFSSHSSQQKKDSKSSDNKLPDPEKQKRRIARARERRATIVLGIIMATFILCWLPFFTVYLVSVLCGLEIPGMVFAVMFWGGYCNSALNPLIYTIFNMDFRKAFKRLVFGHRRGR